jgi:hypothetical protein
MWVSWPYKCCTYIIISFRVYQAQILPIKKDNFERRSSKF